MNASARSCSCLTKKRSRAANNYTMSVGRIRCNIIINYSNNCVIWVLNVWRVCHWTRRSIDTIFKWNGLIFIVLYYMFSKTVVQGKGRVVSCCVSDLSTTAQLYSYTPVYNIYVIICKPLWISPENLSLINRQHRYNDTAYII